MSRLTVHAALPQASRDETARQDFVRDLRRRLAGMSAALPGRYAAVAPAYERAHGPIKDRHDARAAMTADPAYQLWSAAQRFSQELNWESVIDTVERTQDRLAQPVAGRAGGTLRLDPELVVPAYHTAQDIHLMPGGYHGEGQVGAPFAGAVYDLGVHIWGTGGLGPENEILGVISAGYQKMSGDAPARVLDMGCAIGNATLPWVRAFPDAEVHGIDVAGACLRYGHARAEAMGLSVHFSQQNAETTDFADGYFDVVVSHLMLHETSRAALPRILAESRRLLRPGGVALHFDATPAGGTDHFLDFFSEWEVHNNNEAFLGTLRDMDVVAMMQEAGFAEAELIWAPGPGADETAEKGYFSFPAAPAFRGVA